MSEAASQLFIWLIPIAPLVSAVLTAFLGPKLMRGRSHLPCCAAILVSFVCSLVVMFAVVPQGYSGHEAHAVVASGYSWLNVGSLHVSVDPQVDAMTALMLVMVTGVSSLVAIFAIGYMHGDPGYPGFFAEVSLFVFSMCMLVLAGNFLLLYMFWEAVGLCSYLLIGFWFRKPSAAAAAKKAFVVNRIGDFGFILGIFLIWTTFGSLNFADTIWQPDRLAAIAAAQPDRITLICLLLFLGAVGKSAQFPLHVWLPDAMEGPTPVSALIHAATMVTAGVYMVARCTPLFVFAPKAQMVVAGIGAATALISALTALTQTDLKRVLAYSTVSQLGFMFMALGAAGGLGAEHATPAVTAGMFHLFTHAFFKALLFLAAGSVMHAMGDVIDMRRFSGLKHALPITHWTFLCGALALSGFPLLSGFWSKDDILANLASASNHAEHGRYFFWIQMIATIAAGLTAFYTFRAYFMTFWGEEKFPEEAGHHPHEAPPAMAWPLRILAVCAVGIGFLLGPTGLYAGYFHHAVGMGGAGVHEINYFVMITSSLTAIAGIGLAWFMYVQAPALPAQLSTAMRPLYLLSLHKFYFDEIYTYLIVQPVRGLAHLATAVDTDFIDQIVDGVGKLPRLIGTIPRRLQNGLVPSYAFVMFGGLVVCVLYVLGFLPG